MPEEALLAVDCERLGDVLLSQDDIKGLNLVITEPASLVSEEADSEGVDIGMANASKDDLFDNMDVAREEDYHLLRPDGEGRMDILVNEIMYRECQENQDGLWLTSVLMSRLARNQIFGEGNKRTAYLTGVIFLRNVQASKGFDGALIPDLTNELTDLLSDIAIKEKQPEDLHRYLLDGMEEFIEEQKNS